MTATDLRESLADLEHTQWAHWTRYMLDNLTPENIARWSRQCDTPYSELTEKEKDSDRNWADRVISIYKPYTLSVLQRLKVLLGYEVKHRGWSYTTGQERSLILRAEAEDLLDSEMSKL